MKKLILLITLFLLLGFASPVQARWNWRRPTPTPRPTATPTVTSTPTPTATPTPTPIKPNRVNPVCISSHLNELSNNDIVRQLDLMQQAGINWTRFDFVWNEMEFAQGTWDFTKYDYIVNSAQSRGMQVIALLVQWGMPDYLLQGRDYMTPITATDFVTFSNAVASHFIGRIKLYEVGNEPNLAMFWPPSPDVVAYTELLKSGYTTLKSVDSNVKVISAGLAPVGDWQGFIHGMYYFGGKDYFDYLGYHPYSWPNSPDSTSSPAFGDLSTVKDIENFYGDNKLIMATEVGWPSTTASGGVTEATQATYIDRVFKKIMVEGYQYVQLACIYDFKNDGTSTTNPEHNFGILRYNYTKKPSFNTMLTNRNYFNSHFTQVNP
jgi:arabinogalactan endo-1,4-beta-galactosidase